MSLQNSKLASYDPDLPGSCVAGIDGPGVVELVLSGPVEKKLCVWGYS